MTEQVAHIRNVSLESLRSCEDASEWSGLVVSGAYQDALQQIETELHADGAHFTARLWWVLCQLELKSLPAMALTTPLEEIFDKVEQENKLRPAGCEAFLRVAELLAKRGQLRLAVIMAKRAYQLSRLAEKYTAKDRNVVADACRQIVQQELDRASAKLEKTEYLDSLRAELDGIEDEDEDEAAPISNAEPKSALGSRKKNKAVFNSKSILEETFAPESPAPASQEKSVVGESASVIADAVTASERRRGGALKALLIGGAACLLLALALNFQKIFSLGVKLGDVELAMASPVTGGAIPVLPVPRKLGTSAIDTSELESVQSRLNQLAIGNSRSDREDGAAPAPTIEDVANDPSVDQAAMQVPQQVDIATLEPERKEQPQKVDPKKVPLINPADLNVAKIEDLGRSPGGARVERGRDGRMYGPPPASARGLDGAPVQGVEVQQFNKPALYRTVTATAVLEAPSVLAASVERLEANAKIQVVSQMGQWLELRSTAGRRGYIFAQDAVKIE